MVQATSHPLIPKRSQSEEVRLFDPTSSILDFNMSGNDWSWTGPDSPKQHVIHKGTKTANREIAIPERKGNGNKVEQRNANQDSYNDISSMPALDHMTLCSYESNESSVYQPLKPPAPSRIGAKNSKIVESSESTDDVYNSSAHISISTGKNSAYASSLSSFSPISKASKNQQRLLEAPVEGGFFKYGDDKKVSTDEALKALDKRFAAATKLPQQAHMPADVEEMTQATFISGVTLPVELDYDLVRNPFDQMNSSSRRVDKLMPLAPSRLKHSEPLGMNGPADKDFLPKRPGRGTSVIEEEHENSSEIQIRDGKEPKPVDTGRIEAAGPDDTKRDPVDGSRRRRDRSRSRDRNARKLSSSANKGAESGDNDPGGGLRRSSSRQRSRSHSESADGTGGESDAAEGDGLHRSCHRHRSTSRAKTRSSSTGRSGSGDATQSENQDNQPEERRRRRRERSSSRSRPSRNTSDGRSANENDEVEPIALSINQHVDDKGGTSEGETRRRRRSSSRTRRSSSAGATNRSSKDTLGQSSHSTGSRRRRRSKSSSRRNLSAGTGDDLLLSPVQGEGTQKEVRRRKRSSSMTASRDRSKSTLGQLSSSSEHGGDKSLTRQSTSDDDEKATRVGRRSSSRSSRDRRRRGLSDSNPSTDEMDGWDGAVTSPDLGVKSRSSRKLLNGNNEESIGKADQTSTISRKQRSSRKLDAKVDDRGDMMSPLTSSRHRSSRQLGANASESDMGEGELKTPRRSGKQRSARRLDCSADDVHVGTTRPKSPRPGPMQKSNRRLDVNAEATNGPDKGGFMSPRKTSKQRSSRKLDAEKDEPLAINGNPMTPREAVKQRSSRKLTTQNADGTKESETPKSQSRNRQSSSRRLNASNHSSTSRSSKPKSSRSLSSKRGTPGLDEADEIEDDESFYATNGRVSMTLAAVGRMASDSKAIRSHGMTLAAVGRMASDSNAIKSHGNKKESGSHLESKNAKLLGSFMQSTKPRSSKSIGNTSSTPTSPTVMDEEDSTPTTPGGKQVNESSSTPSGTAGGKAEASPTGKSRWIALKGGINFINNTKKQVNSAAKTPRSRKDILATSRKQAEGDRIASIVAHVATDRNVEEAPTSLRLASAAVDKAAPKKNSKWNKIKTSMDFVGELKRQAEQNRGHSQRHLDLREEEDDATIESQLSPRQKRISSMINRLDGVKSAVLSASPKVTSEGDNIDDRTPQHDDLWTPRKSRRIKFIPKSEMERLEASEAAPSETSTSGAQLSTFRFTPKSEVEQMKEKRQVRSKWASIRGGMQFINNTKKRMETGNDLKSQGKSPRPPIHDDNEGEIEFFDPNDEGRIRAKSLMPKTSDQEGPLFHDYDNPPEGSEPGDEEIVSLQSPSPQRMRRSQRRIKFVKRGNEDGNNADAASAAPSLPSLCDYSLASQEKSPTSMKWKKLKNGMDFIRESKKKSDRRTRRGKQ